jgi:peptidoglycan/xylan/chitin deacetylase (PgdA/CDA1 family)
VLAPHLLTGATTMPAGTLCLTFDDGPGETAGNGPGPKTLLLARYLADEEVPAAFFMCGAHVAELPEAPASVRALGHLVGNHTWHHWHLPAALAAGRDVVGEVAETDAVLGLPADEAVFVRPPYGDWSPDVADALNAAPEVGAGRFGPVGWDVETDDWMLWQRRASPDEAAAAVLAQIELVGRGIVLMHDSTADLADARAGNAAYETTQVLVPRLRERGYRFVGLDQVTFH